MIKYLTAIVAALSLAGCFGVPQGGLGPPAALDRYSATVALGASADFNAFGLEGAQLANVQWHLREPAAGTLQVSGAASEHATFTAATSPGAFHLDATIHTVPTGVVHSTATITVQ